MRHGAADRIAQICEHLCIPLQPWQRYYLAQIEQHYFDVQFAKMVRGFNR
ncbi:Uncharacterised protein [Mycobacteroides abscessus]|nr:hypothetical protein [Mycobacteroides abscessus]MDO3130072.1 hypothetical protein [Mycobacteroides abscessus subsp. bolletii]MDO3311849.1 hypothetical protein [Mycobacteroides abscessus subsp. abscessus]MDO3345470.1 hypothetical protein [Mycobacteroides abscessus subsp. abscessus]CPT99226.1 Uncharacterised protein [Mycobacteroides abscessus]CPW04943.1 Uncharacterised protein [Mycobacteroides abscessus]